MAKSKADCVALADKLKKLLAKTPHKADSMAPHKCCKPFCNLDVAQRKDKAEGHNNWTANSPQRTGVRLTRKAIQLHTGVTPATMAYIEAEYSPPYQGRGNSA